MNGGSQWPGYSPTGASWETRLLRRYRAHPARLPGLPPRLPARVPAALGDARVALPDPRPRSRGRVLGAGLRDPGRRPPGRAARPREARGRRRAAARDADGRDDRRARWTRGCGCRGRRTAAGADLEALEARLRAAHGVVGTGVEYVRTLVHAMEPHGISDPLVGRALGAAAGLRAAMLLYITAEDVFGSGTTEAPGAAPASHDPGDAGRPRRPRPASSRSRRGDDVVDGRERSSGARLEARSAGHPASPSSGASGSGSSRVSGWSSWDGSGGCGRLSTSRPWASGWCRSASSTTCPTTPWPPPSPRPRRARPSRRTPESAERLKRLRRAGRLGDATVVGEGLTEEEGLRPPRAGDGPGRRSRHAPSGPGLPRVLAPGRGREPRRCGTPGRGASSA